MNFSFSIKLITDYPAKLFEYEALAEGKGVSYDGAGGHSGNSDPTGELALKRIELFDEMKPVADALKVLPYERGIDALGYICTGLPSDDETKKWADKLIEEVEKRIKF